jgi:hypothetical protein
MSSEHQQDTDSILDFFFPERHNPVVTPTHFDLETQMTLHIPEDEQQKFRQEITARIKSELPLDIMAHRAYGDTYLIYSAIHMVLTKLCEEEGIDPSTIQLRLCESGKSCDSKPDFFNLTAASNKLHFKYHGYDLNNPELPRWFYAKDASLLAENLGIKLTDEDFKNPPRMHKMDYGPMSTFESEEQVIAMGDALRALLKERIGDREIVVLVQSGSFSEKRYSDDDLRRISKAIKEKNPNSYIIVVSDKQFLKKEAEQKKEAEFTDFSFASRFPVDSEDFLQELETDVKNEEIELVLYPKTMQEAATFFYAGDSLIATDSFWAHCAAAANALRNGGVLTEDSFRVLYTMADPRCWGIPGATSIQSEASFLVFKPEMGESFSVMPKKRYHSASSKETDKEFGIAQADIQRVIDTL